MTGTWIYRVSFFAQVSLVAMAVAATLFPFGERVNAALQVPTHMRFEPLWRDKADCGPLCLYLLMRLQDRQVSVADVKKILPFKPERGCSLADIARAADMLDFSTEIRFVNPRDVSKLPYPFILHSEGSIESGVGHFQVIVGYISAERRYYTIDTTYENFRTQSEESLLRDFTGYVLLPKDRLGLIIRPLSSVALIFIGCILALAAVFSPFRRKVIEIANS